MVLKKECVWLIHIERKFIPREDCFKFYVGGFEPFDMVTIQIDFSDGQHNDA